MFGSVKGVKETEIENLDSCLEQLAPNVRKNGGHVHFAFKAEDAVSNVSEIVRKKGAR